MHGPAGPVRWLLARASGELAAEVAEGLGVEARKRPEWTVCWAVPVDAEGTPQPLTEDVLHAPTPTDSFPGLTALVTGGTPKSTGVYYDDSYDRTLFPPGSDCTGKPGTEVTYFEILAFDFTQLFSPINPANLPRVKDAKGNCKPLFPHEFIKVNTVFEVIRAAGGYTAWSDKHPAYDLVNGPSGKGVVDLYTPEINSLIANGGTANGVNLSATLAQCDGTTNSVPLAKVDDYTTCMPAVMAYDEELANRIRELIANQGGVVEKKMFGGLAFLIGGHMSVSVSGKGGLLLRVPPEETEAMLGKPHAHSAGIVIGCRRGSSMVATGRAADRGPPIRLPPRHNHQEHRKDDGRCGAQSPRRALRRFAARGRLAAARL